MRKLTLSLALVVVFALSLVTAVGAEPQCQSEGSSCGIVAYDPHFTIGR
jgi:hypothetical protein